MNLSNVFYLPSGRIFLHELNDNYLIESTEMRDVAVDGKFHKEVRETEDPRKVWKHLVPYEDKWLLTVSTQRGCVHNCNFCDVAPLPFKGNLSQDEIEQQVSQILINTPYVEKSNKVKIGFARMGEPAHNIYNVLGAMERLPKLSHDLQRNYNWLPCFNSILPKKTTQNLTWQDVVDKVIDIKENLYNGFLHFQISSNSTDENKRKELFGNSNVATIEDVIKYINEKKISNRTITLNFIVMKGIEVDVDKLMRLGLNKDKFCVKLIPLNNTENSVKNNLETYANYSNMDDLISLAKKFEENNIPVVYDAIAKCEEAGLCCGQLAQIYQ